MSTHDDRNHKFDRLLKDIRIQIDLIQITSEGKRKLDSFRENSH